MSIGLGFLLPALLGVCLDRWWKTSPAATLIGAVLGFALGMYQTLILARTKK